MNSKKIFELPFIGIAKEEEGLFVLYAANGDFSSILQIENLSLQYGANPDVYEDYHNLLGQIIKIIGPGYILQKIDIIANKQFAKETCEGTDYLSKKYFAHFNGRTYRDVSTHLVITKQNTGGRFFSYDPKELREFTGKVAKISDTLTNNKLPVKYLTESDIKLLFRRYQAFNFTDEQFPLGSIGCDEKRLYFDNTIVRSVTLIDIDEQNIPTSVSSYTVNQELGKSFPVDNFSFLLNVPGADAIVYNQVITVPDQRKLKQELELKKKRSSSIPDAANKLSVLDIDNMFIDIAQENELLVYAHFNILVSAKPEQSNKAVNFIENSLFNLSIIPSKNNYNQMELFRASIPGNAGELKKYDLFLTSRPAAICFFLKERLLQPDKSHYLLYFTDRQGVPIGVDTSELPMSKGRITNRNRFILGPSGSGKSFFTNSYAKQCKELGADIVLVDTGNSYYGLCRYFGGKYITYTEKKPITMNPFKIGREEFNLEKIQILVSLIGMIWKGVDGKLSTLEDDILTKCVTHYFEDYFGESKQVASLSYNTFYEYSCAEIQAIIEYDGVRFELLEYKFILRKFYKGGMYDTILNDDVESTLFNESFIVFEIDNIKEHKLLFPITTLIIMDVFLQKMRHKKNKKVLIIEEAWKAIASPMMAGYILYLYKTVRKWGGEAIVVTQELSDIVGNAVVKDSIISNSDTICLLDQSKFKDRFEEIAEILSLNQVERNKIFTINKLDNKEGRNRFNEVYIRRGAVGEVYGVEVPLEEYMTYTTERTEKEALQIYLDHYGNYEMAMEMFVQDFRESNIRMDLFAMKVNKQKSVLTKSLKTAI